MALSIQAVRNEFSASSGDFSINTKKGESHAPISREGISNLGGFGFIRWEDVLRVEVYDTKGVFILKSPNLCSCGATSASFNLNCKNCDGWGVQEGKRINISHSFDDTTTKDWYIYLEGVLQFWARQSVMKTRLPDDTPVYEKEVPRVIFKCSSIKDAANPSSSFGQGMQTEISRNFAYHDEYKIERLKLALKNTPHAHLIPLLPNYKTFYNTEEINE